MPHRIANELPLSKSRAHLSRRVRAAAAVSGAAVCLWASAALAVEWRAAPTSRRYPGPVAAAARAYLSDAKDALVLGGVELEQKTVLPLGELGTVRFTQRHRGVPVLGAQAAVRVDAGGSIRVVVLDVARHLTVSTAPTVPRTEAMALARARSVHPSARATASLAVVPSDRGGRLAWVVDGEQPAFGPVRILIDAHSGAPIDVAERAVGAKGRIYPINPVKTPQTSDVELVDLDPSEPQTLSGWSGLFTVASYVFGLVGDMEVEQSALADANGDFLFQPPASATDSDDAFAQVAAYHHMSRMRGYFGGLGVDMSAPSWRLVAVSNVTLNGFPMDNAYFTASENNPPDRPNLIAIGQGTDVDFALDSDVILHEFTHYVNYNAVGFNLPPHKNDFGYVDFARGMDEGIADYFSSTVNGDPVVGDAALGEHARDLSESHQVCPDDLGSMDPHADGRVLGGLTWEVRSALGAEAADLLVWGATSLLTPDSSFGDFGTALVQTANDLVSTGTLEASDVATIESLVAGRGLDDCGNVLALTDDEPARTTRLGGLQATADSFLTHCDELAEFILLQSDFQFEAHAPPTGELRLRVDLAHVDEGDGPIEWNVYVRRGAPVEFRDREYILGTGEARHYDYSLEGNTGDSAEIVIDGASDPPLDPSAEYYLAITHRDCPDMAATVSLGGPPATSGSGGASSSSRGTGGAGGDQASAPPPAKAAASDEGTGCACGTAGPASTPWLGAALVALVAALRRRKGREPDRPTRHRHDHGRALAGRGGSACP